MHVCVQSNDNIYKNTSHNKESCKLIRLSIQCFIRSLLNDCSLFSLGSGVLLCSCVVRRPSVLRCR